MSLKEAAPDAPEEQAKNPYDEQWWNNLPTVNNLSMENSAHNPHHHQLVDWLVP